MSKYSKTIRGCDDPAQTLVVDVYSVLDAFGVTCPATQHAIKKLLMPGQRGAKSRAEDLLEAMHSMTRALQVAKASEERRMMNEAIELLRNRLNELRAEFKANAADESWVVSLAADANIAIRRELLDRIEEMQRIEVASP